jgi:NTP pyrophosphatase (non-canonical NTP hydrolase)
MSLSVEVAELMELFQWLSLDQAREVMTASDIRKNAIDEIADIVIYTLAFLIETTLILQIR